MLIQPLLTARGSGDDDARASASVADLRNCHKNGQRTALGLGRVQTELRQGPVSNVEHFLGRLRLELGGSHIGAQSHRVQLGNSFFGDLGRVT